MTGKLKHLCSWCIALMLLPGCLIPSRYFMRKNICIEPVKAPRIAQTAYNHEAPMITIWIHGTRLFFRTLYQQAIPYREGLTCADDSTLPYKLRLIATTLSKADPDRFDKNKFYIFNWSGKLCFIEREKAAATLYNELIQLRKEYLATYGCSPQFRIIAHSHGGNVALNLALAHTAETNLCIDELILLACPVQEKTQPLAAHSMFKKIYALYSALDFIQVMDPQGMYRHRGSTNSFFSKRNFPHRQDLEQMKIKIDRRAITHFEFSQSQFLSLLPCILTGIDAWHANITYTQDPNKMHKVLCVYTKSPIPKNTQKIATNRTF